MGIPPDMLWHWQLWELSRLRFYIKVTGVVVLLLHVEDLRDGIRNYGLAFFLRLDFVLVESEFESELFLLWWTGEFVFVVWNERLHVK